MKSVPHQCLQMAVSIALAWKTIAQSEHSDLDETLATYDEMVGRGAVFSIPAFQIARNLVLQKMIREGLSQVKSQNLNAYLATSDDFVQRFGDSDEPEIRMQVATAMFFRAFNCLKFGESSLAITAFDELIERFGNDNVSDLQQMVVRAMGLKAETQITVGHVEEGLHTCDEVEKRLGSLQNEKAKVPNWVERFREKHAGTGPEERLRVFCHGMAVKMASCKSPADPTKTSGCHGRISIHICHFRPRERIDDTIFSPKYNHDRLARRPWR